VNKKFCINQTESILTAGSLWSQNLHLLALFTMCTVYALLLWDKKLWKKNQPLKLAINLCINTPQSNNTSPCSLLSYASAYINWNTCRSLWSTGSTISVHIKENMENMQLKLNHRKYVKYLEANRNICQSPGQLVAQFLYISKKVWQIWNYSYTTGNLYLCQLKELKIHQNFRNLLQCEISRNNFLDTSINFLSFSHD
jgi:hypothetical protein